ncbi:MAG: exosortase system-associated protein, TIGR04073 family [Candidatus Omnitrophica bacterium]|nr:exosortase system-associated protein, TIGR04073 family [Candidatus Omnitrophota bacterium]
MKKAIICIISIFVLLYPTTAQAILLSEETLSSTDIYEADDRPEFTKLSRGLFNFVTAPLELFINMYEISKEEGVLKGILLGFPIGIARGIFRATAGLVEIATFPFDPYGPIIKPEYLLLDNTE